MQVLYDRKHISESEMEREKKTKHERQPRHINLQTLREAIAERSLLKMVYSVFEIEAFEIYFHKCCSLLTLDLQCC